MIYKLHSNRCLQEVNLNSSILLILLPSVARILCLKFFCSKLGKCCNTPNMSWPKIVFNLIQSYWWMTPVTFCPDNLKLRLRSIRLANLLEQRVENIPEKQVSGSHICNTWNLTLGMMQLYYLKTGECWVEHMSGQNSSDLHLHSQLATGKWATDQEFGHGLFLNSKAQSCKQVSETACASLVLSFPLSHQKKCFPLGLAFLCKLLNLLSSCEVIHRLQ